MHAQCFIGVTCQWSHHRIILGKVYQLDSDVHHIDIPGGRVVRTMDFGYQVPMFGLRP